MIVVIAIGMLLAGVAVGGVGVCCYARDETLTGVAPWSRRILGVVLLLVASAVVIGMAGAVVDPH